MSPYRLAETLGIKFGDCVLEEEVLGHAHRNEKVICVQDYLDEPTIVHEIAHHTVGCHHGHDDIFKDELEVLELFCGVKEVSP